MPRVPIGTNGNSNSGAPLFNPYSYYEHSIEYITRGARCNSDLYYNSFSACVTNMSAPERHHVIHIDACQCHKTKKLVTKTELDQLI